MNKPWIAERTDEINNCADAVSALDVGEGVTVALWTDCAAYTIIRKTPTRMTLRADKAELLNGQELKFLAGGFAAHCVNQEVQRYSYEPDLGGHEVNITLRRWKDEEGNERRKWKRSGTGTHEVGGNAYAGRAAFRDYNF